MNNQTYVSHQIKFSAYDADGQLISQFNADEIENFAERQGFRDKDLDIAHPENYDFEKRMPSLIRDWDDMSPYTWYWDVTSDPTDIIYFRVEYK